VGCPPTRQQPTHEGKEKGEAHHTEEGREWSGVVEGRGGPPERPTGPPCTTEEVAVVVRMRWGDRRPGTERLWRG